MSKVVNKLIFNCLVQYGNVALPNVGSLEVVAESEQKSGIRGGQKVVRFSPAIKDSHIPVTEIIAEQGNLSEEAAATLYKEWLSKARGGDGELNIESVGVLTIKGSVAIADELNRALNGDKLPAASLPQRKCKLLWLWILLAVLAVGVAVWLLCPCCNNRCKAEPVIEEVAAVEEVAQEPVQDVVEAPKITPPAANKRYNVAVGVFSIKYNARACAKQDPLGIGAENYTITPFPSGLWVVIAYASNNLNDAERMRKEYKKIQPDVWVYRRW